jgi:hypothetical protein
MKKIFLLIAAVAVLQITASSQSKFIRGYIVTHEKDTLKGEISDDIYVRIAPVITFRNKEKCGSILIQTAELCRTIEKKL